MSQEIALHRNITHENVVAFHSFFEDKDFVYVVLELCRRRVCHWFTINNTTVIIFLFLIPIIVSVTNGIAQKKKSCNRTRDSILHEANNYWSAILAWQQNYSQRFKSKVFIIAFYTFTAESRCICPKYFYS